MRRVEAIVSGRVQGVGFRDFVRREADARQLAGYVRNSDDGRRVELVAEGAEEALAGMIEAVRRGPRLARVEDVSIVYGAATGGFARFSVEI